MVNIYLEEDQIPVHVKILSKNKLFSKTYNTQNDFTHRIFASSRLVFSKDDEITRRYDSGRYYLDAERDRWNLVYVGNFIKLISVCKKYLNNKSYYTAFSFAVKSAEEYAKINLNTSGYMINNNALNMVVSMNDKFKKYIDELFFKKDDIHIYINNIVNYMEENIYENIKELTSILIKYMSNKNCFLSSSDIKQDELFKDYKINFEDILNELFKLNIIKREKRDYKIDTEKVLIKENVYYI
ncbi:MAG: nucleotidyltransferase domain-containing protein [Clostridium sp.]|nr:nucleotidyltransferase domain-containing protein [Clostridium sp.]